MGIDEVAYYNSEAIIGMAERINFGPVVAYDASKIIKILTEGGMTQDEALEYYNFNVSGAWLGEYSPVFIYTDEY
jgi:hypothetical protein